MENKYEAQLKTYVMQIMTGEVTLNLREYVNELLVTQKEDIIEITQAYFFITREIMGEQGV